MTDVAILAQAISNGIIDGQAVNLRDQIAIHILPYVISEEAFSCGDCFKRFGIEEVVQIQPHHWMILRCEKAYQYADAMLEAREKTNDR